MVLNCPYFNRGECRSCDLIELDYSTQIDQKEQLVSDTFQGALLHTEVLSSVRSQEKGFRNRAKMSVTGSIEHPIIGLTGERILDEGRELLHCPIHHPKLNELIAALPEFIRSYRLYPYSIAERKGEIKGLIAFYSPHSRQMYLRFILRSKDCISRIIKGLPVLQKQFPELTSISANLQPTPHAILEGKKEIFLTPEKSIHHELRSKNGLLRFQLSPQAFVQTNVEIATELYEEAASWIQEAKTSRMLDLFCGQGAFSFFAARHVEEILGIEINSDAVHAANETAKRFEHIRFQCADATRVSEEIAKFKPDLILVNPPRRGLADGVGLLLKHQPKTIIYSSCALDTLKTDVEKLSGSYRIKKIRIFDMFPHTKHFETLLWLDRK